jgi:hypothetical protein
VAAFSCTSICFNKVGGDVNAEHFWLLSMWNDLVGTVAADHLINAKVREVAEGSFALVGAQYLNREFVVLSGAPLVLRRIPNAPSHLDVGGLRWLIFSVSHRPVIQVVLLTNLQHCGWWSRGEVELNIARATTDRFPIIPVRVIPFVESGYCPFQLPFKWASSLALISFNDVSWEGK